MSASEQRLSSQSKAIAIVEVHHHRPTCLLVTYGVAQEDPTTKHVVHSLTVQGFCVAIVQLAPASGIDATETDAAITHNVTVPDIWRLIRPLYNWVRWRCFVAAVCRQMEKIEPQLVVTIMLHAIAALPRNARSKRRKLMACVYDIPSLQDAGKLDRRIFRPAWARLSEFDVVWASDAYKAKLTQEFGGLRQMPLVCHNCPRVDYLPSALWPRDSWLRSELRRNGASIGETGGSILLRAGAVGPHCGIEETFEAMTELPENYIFIMMGRPSADYKQRIQSAITRRRLDRRAFFWDRPSDESWKNALLGADIGHMIHGPFPPGRIARSYEMNSSLSNYRLFYYMAAGLPILAYDDPRMSDIQQEVQCFRVARVSHLKNDILTAWRELEGDGELRRNLGSVGRRAHLDKYCWEKQFAPVAEAIEH